MKFTLLYIRVYLDIIRIITQLFEDSLSIVSDDTVCNLHIHAFLLSFAQMNWNFHSPSLWSSLQRISNLYHLYFIWSINIESQFRCTINHQMLSAFYRASLLSNLLLLLCNQMSQNLLLSSLQSISHHIQKLLYQYITSIWSNSIVSHPHALWSLLLLLFSSKTSSF